MARRKNSSGDGQPNGTVQFEVTDTWVFHDVDGNGGFTPGVDTPGPDNHPDDPVFQQQTGWAPMLPTISVNVPALGLSIQLPG